MDFSNRTIEVRASTGIAYGYTSNGDETQIPPTDIDILADVIDGDNVLSAAFDATVDVATMNGYGFYGDEVEAAKAQDDFDNILNFDETLDNIYYQLLRSDAYIELVSTNKGPLPFEVHPLESREIEIVFDEHGEPIKYVQKPKHSDVIEVEFDADKIIHIRNKWIGSNPYSQNPFKSIERPLRVKRAGLIYLQSIFQNFPPKLLYILKQANLDQSKAFQSQLRVVKNTPGRDMVAFGDADVKETGINLFQKGLVDILEYLRREIAMITRIPPSWVGIRDGGGRGQSETETLSFLSRIKKLQQKIESAINKYLLPKLGYKNIKFKFHPVSMTDEKAVMEVAERMKNMLLEDEVILHYMTEKGIQIPVDAKFKEPIQNVSSPVLQKNKDLMPSRNRKDAMIDPKGSSMTEMGVSSEGTKKLEAKQMKMRSAIETFPEMEVPTYWQYQHFE